MTLDFTSPEHVREFADGLKLAATMIAASRRSC
jgi:hypothetical protein